MRRSLWVVLGVVLAVGCQSEPYCNESGQIVCSEDLGDSALCYAPGKTPAECLAPDDAGLTSCTLEEFRPGFCDSQGRIVCPVGWTAICY